MLTPVYQIHDGFLASSFVLPSIFSPTDDTLRRTIDDFRMLVGYVHQPGFAPRLQYGHALTCCQKGGNTVRIILQGSAVFSISISTTY